jgi:hypothetical protein
MNYNLLNLILEFYFYIIIVLFLRKIKIHIIISNLENF